MYTIAAKCLLHADLDLQCSMYDSSSVQHDVMLVYYDILYVCIFIQSISKSYNVFTLNKSTTRIGHMD